MKQIFLISGIAEAGKDSVAIFLKEKLPGKTLILHNADYLKYIACKYLGWDGCKNEYGRTLLQKLGTERTRFNLKKPLFWVEKSCDVIEILENDFDFFIIPDTRFKNEIFYPQSRFPALVKTIRVIRLNYENNLTPEQRNHISETDLIDVKHDYYIRSKSGLQFLELEVNNFLSILKENQNL
jgi:hypothetical protein